MKKLPNNIPVLILCGGKGLRLSEETQKTPKPLIKIDKFPILHHIIQIYLKNGFKNFILLTGYKSKLIEQYFIKEFPKVTKQKSIFSKKKMTISFKNFDIKLLYTGLNTQTGARILKSKKIIGNNKYFAVTYGDGLANIDLNKVFSKLYKTNFDGIMCATNPEEKFGVLKIKDDLVEDFYEKKKDLKKWINIGFFIFKKNFFKYLDNKTMLEDTPLKKISKKKKLIVYKHFGYYRCMDTLNDKNNIKNDIKKNKTLPWQK